jgi:hypothetical protein
VGGKSEKPDARGGNFLLLPLCLVASEAFRTASPRAIKALLVIWQHHNGFNNGRIGVGFRELAEGMDSQYHEGNIKAVGELIARGIVALSADRPKAERQAREYRLTFIPTKGAPATHDYLSWTTGDAGTRVKPRIVAGTRKNGLADTATETAQSVAITATGLKKSAADTATGKSENNGNPPFPDFASAADTATHIVNQSVPLSRSANRLSGNSGGAISAAPDADEVRRRTVGLVKRLGRGTQGKLAKEARLSAASMSRFLNSNSDLDERARIRLTLALPKVETLGTGAPIRRAGASQ